MDTYTQSLSGAVVGPAKSPERQLRTLAEKRQIVEETMVEGAYSQRFGLYVRAGDDVNYCIAGPGVFTLLSVVCTLRRISPRSCSVSAHDDAGVPFVSSNTRAFSAY